MDLDSTVANIKPDGVRYGAIAGIIIGTIPSLVFLERIWNTPLDLEFPMTICFIPCLVIPFLIVVFLACCVPNLGIGVLIGLIIEKLHQKTSENVAQHQIRLALFCGLVAAGITLPIFSLLLFFQSLVELFWIVTTIVCAVLVWGLAAALISIYLSRSTSNQEMWRTSSNV